MKIDLDELHQAIKRVDDLLSDRHIGLMTWNAMLADALQELDETLWDQPDEKP